MLVSRNELGSKLLNSVCEIKFARRLPKDKPTLSRRMLCTKSSALLNSTNGRVVLNYRPPKYAPNANESRDNLLIVWDIMVQDYRCVSMDQVELIREFPADDSFWVYFNQNILPMSAGEKEAFMNS